MKQTKLMSAMIIIVCNSAVRDLNYLKQIELMSAMIQTAMLQYAILTT